MAAACGRRGAGDALRQCAHLRCESQPGASARPLVFPAAWRQPAGEGPCKRDCRRTLAARAPSVRNAAGGFRPTALTPSRLAAACGQTALQTRLPMHTGSARTFGAKRSRGLPPNRSYSQPHGGSLRANGTANATADAPWQRAHLRCETQPGAAARPLVFPAAWRQPAGKRRWRRDGRRTLAARAPSVRNAAGGCRQSSAFRSFDHPISSGICRSCSF